MRSVSVESRYAKPRAQFAVWKDVRLLTGLPLRPMTRGALDDSLKMKAGVVPRWKTVLYPVMSVMADSVLSKPLSSSELVSSIYIVGRVVDLA